MNLRRLCLPLLGGLLPFTAHADTVIKIPRENGAVHQEFRSMFSDVFKGFKSGVGRAELPGSGEGDRCVLNFFTNTDTTFVTLNLKDRKRYVEFYIDHPTQSFKNILFQTVTIGDEGRELKVVSRDSEYSLLRDNDRVVVTSRNPGEKNGLSCNFDAGKVSLHEGEAE